MTPRKAPCHLEGCDNPRHEEHAYCEKHHNQRKRYGVPAILVPCATEGCDREVTTGARYQLRQSAAPSTSKGHNLCQECQEAEKYPTVTCQVKGCDKKEWLQGFCQKHYEDERRESNRRNNFRGQHGPTEYRHAMVPSTTRSALKIGQYSHL